MRVLSFAQYSCFNGKHLTVATILNALHFAGLPMSLSSTGNSLKSSGTFTSNSSINSTPSVDRYAALKDLDEQLREMKEKDVNTQPTTNPANPFNAPASATVGNPFQATQIHSSVAVPTQNGWHNEQQQFNGTSPNMFGSPHGFGMNGVATGPYMNGNGLQQLHQQQYQKMPSQNLFNGSIGVSNRYAQKNPFSVSQKQKLPQSTLPIGEFKKWIFFGSPYIQYNR